MGGVIEKMPPRLKRNEPLYILTNDGAFQSIGVIDYEGITISASGKDVIDKTSVPFGAFYGRDGKVTLEFKLSFIDRIRCFWIFICRHKIVQIRGKIRSFCAKIFSKK